MPTNLLTNSGFEGKTYAIDSGGSQWVPEGWQLSLYPPEAPKKPGQDTRWGGPNLGCIDTNLVPPNEHKLFFLDGTHCWKIWTETSWPFGFILSQKVKVTPGKHYRFKVNILPDMVAEYTSKGKLFATDPKQGEAQVFAKSGGRTFSTGFQDGSKMPYGKYSQLTIDFQAPAAEVEVGVEAFGIYGIKNNCFFCDAFELVETEAPQPTVARPKAPTNNLMSNGGFEEGSAYFADDAKQQAVPAGWALEVKDASTERLPKQTADFINPRTELVSAAKLAPTDKERLIAEGVYGWRVSATIGPIWLRLFQGAYGVQPGNQGRITAHVLPLFPENSYCGEVRLTAASGELFVGGEWKPGSEMSNSSFNAIDIDFKAGDVRVEVSLEIRCNAALPQGAWYVDLVTLEVV